MVDKEKSRLNNPLVGKAFSGLNNPPHKTNVHLKLLRVLSHVHSLSAAVVNRNNSTTPSFNESQCLAYFKKTPAAVYPNKLYNIPSWIPTLSNPMIKFDLEPPTYQQVTNIVRSMKASGSPCPLDQIYYLLQTLPFSPITSYRSNPRCMVLWFHSSQVEESLLNANS